METNGNGLAKPDGRADRATRRHVMLEQRYLEVLCNPQYDGLAQVARAKVAKVGFRFVIKCDRNPDFMKLVRESRLKLKTRNFQAVDDALVRIATEGDNDQAAVRASQLIYERFDPDYKPQGGVNVGISFVDLVRMANGQEPQKVIDAKPCS